MEAGGENEAADSDGEEDAQENKGDDEEWEQRKGHGGYADLRILCVCN